MELDDAIGVKDEVRAFYATGKKSCNKVYFKAKKEALPAASVDTLYDDLDPTTLTKLLTSQQKLDKMATRNADASVSIRNRPLFNKSYYKMGQEIYNAGQTSGNCMEMAAVASYLLVQTGKASSGDLLIAEFQKKGDHAFAVAGSQPGGASVSSMTGSAFIIDPWLNTACKASDYFWEVQERLKKWHRDGKRIYWASGPLGAGWYDPGKSYQDAFLSAEIVYRSAT